MTLTTDDALDLVRHERNNQKARWSTFHDRHHERFEWVGLIATYAAEGRFKEAAALAVAAMEAQS